MSDELDQQLLDACYARATRLVKAGIIECETYTPEHEQAGISYTDYLRALVAGDPDGADAEGFEA